MEAINELEKIPLVLVIKSLLNMHPLDLSTILDLIKSVPNVCTELGTNARDLIAIWVLENLYSRVGFVKPRSETRMGVSKFCEEVLSLVLEGGIDEKCMLGVGSCVEDCSLYRVENGMLEGSGLGVGDEDSGICFRGGVFDGIGEKCGVCDNVDGGKSGVLKGRDHVMKRLVDGRKLRVGGENRGISCPGDVSDGVGEKRDVCDNMDRMKNGSDHVMKRLVYGSGLRVGDENTGSSVLGGVSDGISEKRGVCDNVDRGKNGILEGSDHVLKRLVDGRGLRVGGENTGISVLGGVSAGIGEKRGVCENMEVKRFTSEDDEISEGNLCVEKLSPAKRVRNIVVDRNCEVAYPESCGTFGESRKKVKRVLLSFAKNHSEVSALACRHERLGDSSSRTVEHIEELVDRETGPEVHTGEENIGENGSSEANNSIGHSIENNVYHALSKDNDVLGENLEISSDGDEYTDARTDIATKNCFLSSQGIGTQDSFGTRLNSCVKCNKGGNVLSCGSSSCPLVVHEECLGSATDFDRIGNFRCPFCAYQGAVSRYQKAKKKFLLSRIDLMNFHASRADVEVKELSKRSHGSKKHESSEIQNISEHIEPTTNNDLLTEDIGNLIPPSKLDEKVGEPSKLGLSGANEKSGCRDQDVIPGRETHNRMSEKLPCQSDSDATVEEGFNAESEINDARYCISLGLLGRQIKDPIAQLRKKLARTNVEGQTLKTWEFNTEDPNEKWSTICKGSPRSK